jgi:tetratricopeptide (TPR) repeat protein
MKFIINIVVIVFLASSGLHSQSVLDLSIANGNNAYDSANYKEAIEHYSIVVDSGYASSQLYYNIGNAYFKLNDMPSAILFYEKAKKLSPKDDDILFNLSIANSRIVDRIDAIPELFYVKWWNSFTQLFSPRTWLSISIALFFFIFLFAIIFIISRNISIRRITLWAGLAVVVLTIISFSISYQTYYQFTNKEEAIIFIPTLTVKSSPNPNSVDLFVIHEGTKVSISDAVEGWSEIKIANGSVGWVPTGSFKKI